MKKYLFLLSSLFLTLSLSACSNLGLHQNETSAYLEKEMVFDSDMVLAESKHWNPAGSGRYWLFSFGRETYFNNYINATIPSYQAYQENPKKWQKWNGSTLTGWGRVKGVIPKGTKFHIIDISPTGQGKSYWVTVEVDGGDYKNLTALYVNAKHIVPGLYS